MTDCDRKLETNKDGDGAKYPFAVGVCDDNRVERGTGRRSDRRPDNGTVKASDRNPVVEVRRNTTGCRRDELRALADRDV